MKAAIGIIEQTRSGISEERYRAGYMEDRYQVYVSSGRTPTKTWQGQTMLSFTRKNSARAPILINSAPLLRLGSDPAAQQRIQELGEQIRTLRHAIQKEYAVPEKERRGQALESYSAELDRAERDYEELLDDARDSEPDSKAQAIPTTTEIQRFLPPDTALIEYVVGRQTISILLITRLSVIGLPVSIASGSLSSRTELLRDLIMERRSGMDSARAGALHFAVEASPKRRLPKRDPPVADRPGWRPELCAVRRVADQPISIPGRRVHGCLSAVGGGFGDRIGWQ